MICFVCFAIFPPLALGNNKFKFWQHCVEIQVDHLSAQHGDPFAERASLNTSEKLNYEHDEMDDVHGNVW